VGRIARRSTQMVKLLFSRRFPYVRLADEALRRQVDVLRKDNDELRERVVAAQHEKAIALQQAEQLRKEKERLRLRIVALKRAAESQHKVLGVLESKVQVLREENERLSDRD